MKLASNPINPFHREDEYGSSADHGIWPGFNPVSKRLVSSDSVLKYMTDSTWRPVARIICFEVVELIREDLVESERA